MKMITIKVDEEVYRFIESKAVPFVDQDVNSVLRKLLLTQRANMTNTKGTVIELHDYLYSVPNGLRQILQVIDLVKQGDSRVEATKKVAQLNDIEYSTVVDKYARQLGKRVFEINEMLQEPKYYQFKALLQNKFNIYSDKIEEFFNKL